MTEDDVCRIIVDYLKSAARGRSLELIGPTTKIYAAINSYAVVELVTHLSATLGREIDLAQAESEDLETPASFARFIARAQSV